MAEYTKNLNLKKPDKTDFYNIDDYNENMDKLDEIAPEDIGIADYPIEQGTIIKDDTTWHYEKWNSGKLILWAASVIETNFTNKIAEGHWEGESFPRLTYPFTLYGTIYLQFSLYFTASGTHISYCLSGETPDQAKETPTYKPYSAVEVATTKELTCRYYVITRWKQ